MEPSKAVDASLLCACAIWLATHRILQERGFVIGRRWLSTDITASLLVGLAASVWSVAVIWKTVQSPTTSSLQVAALLSEAPLLVQTLFWFWIASYIDGLRVEVLGKKPYSWALSNLNGPFDWASGLTSGFYLTLCAAVSLAVSIPSLAAVAVGDQVRGVLNIVGVIVFLLDGVRQNPYVNAPHRYADGRLRIALPTDHHEGTLYVLPSANRGMDAVWSPKIANEYLEADFEIMALFRQMRCRRWSLAEPLLRIRTTLSAYQRRVLISAVQVERLARFIYLEKSPEDDFKPTISCVRAPNVHLIGRDLMYALCHMEYLVFMGQNKLPVNLQSKLGTLRLMSRSGASNTSTEPLHTIGFSPGIAGYREAVAHVYAIFGEEVDDLAINFDETEPPRYSDALTRSPNSINDYVATLWDTCCEHNESTFTALYMFTTVWFMELGNINGFHPFPLRCRTRDGDVVSQQLVWRQVWYAGIIAQLISVSPAFFTTFFTGFLY